MTLWYLALAQLSCQKNKSISDDQRLIPKKCGTSTKRKHENCRMLSEWGMTHFVLKLSVKSLTCKEYFVEENSKNKIEGNIWQTMKDSSNARLMAAI